MKELDESKHLCLVAILVMIILQKLYEKVAEH